MKIKLLIFDFDGTLGDSKNLIVKTMQESIKAIGRAVPSEESCASTIGLPLKKCFSSLLGEDEELIGKCAELYELFFKKNNMPGAVPPFDGVIQTIEELHKKGIKMAIASNRGHRSLAAFVEEMQLGEMITVVLGADDVEQQKPNAEPALKILAHYGCQPNECMIIGDAQFDILMGKNAGIQTCGVTYGNGTREELEEAGADYIIEHFSELKRILFK